MGGIINDDVRLWISDLTRTVQAEISAATPPQADAVFALPPMPAFPAHESLCVVEGRCTTSFWPT